MRNFVFCLMCLVFMTTGAVADEPTREELEQENAALKAHVAELESRLAGVGQAINLGRTSLATVTASSVNGGSSMSNRYYGIRNAFDNGDNWINNINYTHWLAGDLDPWIEVRFDRPVQVKRIVVQNGPAFTPVFLFEGGGEEPHGQVVNGDLSLERLVPGVTAIRLYFAPQPNVGSCRVDEIRILGFPPDDAEYEITTPRLELTARSAYLIAEDAFQQFGLPSRWTTSVTNETEDRYEVVFHHTRDNVVLFRVTIFKADSRIETKLLARWVPIEETDE